MTTTSDPATPSPTTRDVLAWAQDQEAQTLGDAQDLYETADVEMLLGFDDSTVVEVSEEIERLVAAIGSDVSLDDLV